MYSRKKAVAGLEVLARSFGAGADMTWGSLVDLGKGAPLAGPLLLISHYAAKQKTVTALAACTPAGAGLEAWQQQQERSSTSRTVWSMLHRQSLITCKLK
jgi:hypothetical protein